MRRALLAILSVMMAVGAARAERSLSLDEALAHARAENRDLKQARARLAQAATSVGAAWTALLPTVAAEGRYTHNYKDVSLSLAQFYTPTIGLAKTVESVSASVAAYEATLTAQSAVAQTVYFQKQEQLDLALSARVPLVVPWAYAALDGAKKSYASAVAEHASTEADLLLGTAQAFFGAAGADELVLARGNAVGLARELAEQARRRFTAGSGKRLDLMRAELALTRAEQALEEALDAQAQAYRALATLCQLREPFKVVPPPAVPGSEPAAGQVAGQAGGEPTDDLVKGALRLRPELAALEKAVAARTASLLAQRLKWAPSLSAFGNVRAFNYRGFSDDLYAWAAGLQLDWVLYDAGARDVERRLVSAQRDELAMRLAAGRDAVADEVENASRRVGTKRKALDAAKRSVELSRETLRLVRSQHDEGMATQLDLLAAQDALVTSEVLLAQARFDLALAALTLARDLGQFPPRSS